MKRLRDKTLIETDRHVAEILRIDERLLQGKGPLPGWSLRVICWTLVAMTLPVIGGFYLIRSITFTPTAPSTSSSALPQASVLLNAPPAGGTTKREPELSIDRSLSTHPQEGEQIPPAAASQAGTPPVEGDAARQLRLPEDRRSRRRHVAAGRAAGTKAMPSDESLNGHADRKPPTTHEPGSHVENPIEAERREAVEAIRLLRQR